MGNRATFVFEQGGYGEDAQDNPPIFLYGHYAGYDMMDSLAKALEAALPRIAMDDESYATRITITTMVGDDWRSETGWGLSTYFLDSEHSVPVVNFRTKTVRLLPHDWSTKFDINAEPKFVMSIDAFIRKFSKTPALV